MSLKCCPIILAFLFLTANALLAAEVDLYVTDYNENPTQDQKPLIGKPLVYSKAQEVTIRMADGATVAYKSPLQVAVNREAAGNPREASLFAAPGEYEPFSFLLRAKEDLEQVFITAGELKGVVGAIPAANLAITSVEGYLGGAHDMLMPVGHPWDMAAHSVEYFWCTVKVPENAKAGIYRGEVTVTSKGKPIGAISMILEVLPIRLSDPPFALGFNYSSPKDPKALEAQLADMRAHGMTTVAPLYKFHLPVHDTDTTELGEFIEAYKKAGYPATLYFATPMELQLTALAGYGSETSRRWQQKFIKVMRLLHAETQKHDPPVLMSIGDELTNKGIEGVGVAGRLAKFAWEELPEIAMTSDMNGYMEVIAMAPYLNVATFNNGWDGIDHHNKGRRLMNRGFLMEVQEKTGAIPWFVNAGSGRFPFGFFFWKMSKYGLRGKVEWYYSLDNQKGSFVRANGEQVYPTLDYERSREGIDDLKYVCRLEQLIAEAGKTAKTGAELQKIEAERQKAEALLKSIADSITDDWTAYSSGGQRFPADGFDVMSPEKASGFGRLNSIRRAIADQILALQGTMN
ncbi:MAG: DUF6067 family protein [Candidatus Sumerlaeota bacterium]|nr:DUF6067 family protein [Candidatus Sumerlaeota bacterium]